ncbi:MAG: hypothetical protein ACYDAQ_11915 [Mycobacteriales bacterium]
MLAATCLLATVAVAGAGVGELELARGRAATAAAGAAAAAAAAVAGSRADPCALAAAVALADGARLISCQVTTDPDAASVQVRAMLPSWLARLRVGPVTAEASQALA